VVIDLFSRQVVGWSLRDDMTSNIVIDALRMAWFRRHPGKHAGVLFHSDRGSQLGFKESLQRQFVELRIVGHSMLRQAFSIPEFYEVGH
jgi:transposase InsO family protein